MNRTKAKISHIQKLRFLFLPAVLLVILLAVSITLTGRLPFITYAQTAGTVTFGVVGDMGGDSNAAAVLNSVKSSNLNFFMHVGDFSYDSQGGPSGWPTWVKSIVGATFPYEIISGNHDDCCIDTYVQGLPNKMANLNGSYGKNYYFDYPQTSPLVRMIMIDPVAFATDVNWLTTAIDSARSSGIPWVVVGMHENCISTGAKSCEIPSAIDDLIYAKKVDLIVQGHDHNYQRSKQLTCVKTNTTDQTCIANAGPAFPKGAGSVLVIDGAGGNGFYGVSSSDSEAGYFATINSDTYGYTKFTITPSQLSGQFIKAAGGSLTDSFTITNNVQTTTAPGVTSPPVVSQPWVCGGSTNSICGPVTTIIPSGAAVTNPPVQNPSGTVTQTQPSTSPCATVNYQSRARHPHHNHHKHGGNGSNGGNGAISSLIQQLLNFIMQLLQQLISSLGGSGGGGGGSITPSTSVSPSTMPGPSGNPCPPVSPQPSIVPVTSVSPSGSPVVSISPAATTTTIPSQAFVAPSSVISIVPVTAAPSTMLTTAPSVGPVITAVPSTMLSAVPSNGPVTSSVPANPSLAVSPGTSTVPSSAVIVPSGTTPSSGPSGGTGGGIQSIIQLLLNFIMTFITFILQLLGFKQ